MSTVRKHFCAVVVSGAGGFSRPRKYGICGCIPAVVSSVVWSSVRGTSGADGTRRWPFDSKKDRNPSRISADVRTTAIVGASNAGEPLVPPRGPLLQGDNAGRAFQ